MIHFACPNCRSKLNAKEKLAGQSRKCPKCGTEVRIPAAEEPSAVAAEPAAAAADSVKIDVIQEGLPHFEGPRRLERANRYLICDRASVFAVWSDGSGWMLKTNTGLISAPRNPELLPAEGFFTLVELAMERSELGLHLRGVRCFMLATRYAMIALEQNEDKILTKLTGPGPLSRDQKLAVFRFVKDQFMPEVWEDSQDVRDFLTNDDHVSSGTA